MRADLTPPGCATAGGYSLVLSHLLRAMAQLRRPQPLVCRRRMAAPPHQVVRDAPHLLAVEQQLHLVLALLPRVGHRAGPGA